MDVTAKKTGFERYTAYKDSDVEWLDEVPEHWGVIKLKRIFHEVKKRTNTELSCGSISFGKVVHKDDEKIPEATKKSYQVVLKGDFLVNPLNLNYDLISLRIALSEIDVVVSSGYIVLHNSVALDLGYFKWLLHRFDVAYMKLLGSGVRQTLNFNDIGNSEIVFPPITEQTAIANFLDRKIELIDRAIAQKEKQIELLKERKQVLINKAVTRGLNPNVPLKDSGVEWIGEIPEHWEMKKLKYLVIDVISGPFGSSLIKDEYVNQGYKVYGQEQVIPNDFSIGDYYITEAKFSKMKRYQIFENDILISCVGTFGKIALVPSNFEPGIINPRLIKMTPQRFYVDPSFLQEVLLSPFCFNQFEQISRGGTMGVINIQLISNLQTIVPPINEQTSIVNFIRKTKKKISEAISLKETEIEKLKDYKATLINSAVTGKIKVS